MFLTNFLQKSALFILNKTGYKSTVKNNDNINEDDDTYKKVSLSSIKIINKKKNLINKELHFINVGDKKEYMDLCINSYKYHNPDYKINFINYSYDDFFKQNDVYQLCKKNNFDCSKELDKQQLDKVILDYKYKYIYTYTGILCDLKSFCVRNLDDCLDMSNFIYTCILNDNIIKDKSLIGLQKGYFGDINNTLYPPCNKDDISYESIKLSFFKLRLKINNFQTNNKLLQNYIWSFV